MKPLKYITDPGALEYYNQELVNEIITFFDNELKEKIRQAKQDRNRYKELADLLDRALKTGRAEAPVNYDNRYDRFCNHVMYILDKSDTINIVKERFKDVEFDTIICIIASHIRKKLK